jgi:hypothetical protein
LQKSFLTKYLGIITLLILSLFVLYHVVRVSASEPSLIEIFSNLGFTNLIQTDIETFPAGMYNITLYAEFAEYSENELSYCKVNTSSFTVVSSGSEGFEYILPPITKTFSVNYQFGLSLSRTYMFPYRYFTETSRNPNGTQYARVYKNLDDPSMFLIGFDERAYCDGTGDKDYNDMVFSLQSQHYLNVISSYDTPSGEGWYYNGTEAFASLANNVIDYGNGTHVIFTHWSGDASGTNYSKSEPIYMDQNKTAIANWKIQYHLTVTSSYSSPTPTSKWFDEGTSVTASVVTPWAGPTGTRYVCTGWTGTGSVPSSGSDSSVTFTITQASSITWSWVTQYYLTMRTNPSRIVTIPSEGWYNASKSFSLSAPSVSGYTFLNWDVDGTSQGSGVSSITITMNAPHTATANYATTAPPLTVSIDPTSASILVSQSITFTSTVSGGASPYIYQWYLNGNPVSGATSSNWAFTPASSGICYIHLKVTDAMGNTAQSETAKIAVAVVPVGGQSYQIQVQTRTVSLISYVALVSVLTMMSIEMRRKKKH